MALLTIVILLLLCYNVTSISLYNVIRRKSLTAQLFTQCLAPSATRLYSNSNTKLQVKPTATGTRLNKCIIGLSRRAADEVVKSGKVSVNSRIATCGTRVHRGDVVWYNGQRQDWERITLAKQQQPSQKHEQRDFVYIKFWKPHGVTCTSDLSDPSNIITQGKFSLLPQRVFTVGRLDKDSTGLILLTSDGRVNNAMLSSKFPHEKTYTVVLDRPVTDEQIALLSKGITITTTAQRDSSKSKSSTKAITRKTLPCYVKRLALGGPSTRENTLQFTLTEGKNRQIRRMAEAVGLQVLSLHRTSFAGIGLKGVSEGNWAELTASEMGIIRKSLLQTVAPTYENTL